MAKKYQVEVSDTITYFRKAYLEVEAENPEDAKEKAIEQACSEGLGEFCREEQIDNTPFETGEIEEL